jgi:MYXO-CTERM domain-containing protein
VAETDSALFAQACSGGSTTITLTAGTWYLLFESPTALVGSSPGFDVYRVDVAPTGVAPRPAAATPPTCAIAPLALTISPAVASVPPKGSVTFAASGGTGARTWSLQTNASGGSIDASTGAYTAGATGGAIDVVKVVDAAATSATASVTVTAGVSIAPPSATVPPRGSRSFAASGGSGTGYAWSLQTSASGGLVDAGTGAYTAGSTGSVTDVLRVVDSLGNQATASATVTAGVSISPPSATVAPQGTQALTASGGSGTGYAWSLSANASGGSIDASTGSYTAGATGGVTDTVQVTDSLGNRASASLTVTAVAGGSKKGCGCASGGDPAWALGLGLLALLGRRRGTRRSRR